MASSAEISMTLLTICEWLAPMWLELSFALFFVVGFAYMRRDELLFRSSLRKLPGKGKKLVDHALTGPQAQLHKSMEANLSTGHAEAALKIWRSGKKITPTALETLKLVTKAFLQVNPDNLVQEMLEHMQTHKDVLCGTRTVTTVLDVIARSGHIAIMEEFASVVQKLHGFRIPRTSPTYEVLLGGFAAAGDEPRVKALVAEAHAGCLKITPRAYALTIKGFLKNGMVDAALQQMLDMQRAGFFVPSFAVTQLFRAACEAKRCVEIFHLVWPTLQLSSEAIVHIMEDALKRKDLKFALHVEKSARQATVPLVVGAYESLLKLCAISADRHAIQFFEDMEKCGGRISESLCVCLLARCADSKFLCFAEAIACFMRGRDAMTISVYSSLMKCYAFCGMYDKACDLYQEIKAAGLEPDAMMYGCLMKFATECGRSELSRELFDKAPPLDIQNYMSLIQAAGREKDVERAFSLLNQLEASGMVVDIATYSCVLDACVSAGDMQRARTLLEQMKNTFGSLDIISFNTLLKGYCSLGDIGGAKDFLQEMTSLGFPPNSVSFNCLINALVSKGDFTDAWQTVEMMENTGVPLDNYTISIMMKSLKRVRSTKLVDRVFSLLDRTGLDVCADEVLFNTVLEACIRHNQRHRLDAILSSLPNSSLRPGIHTYGSLIKASSTLKRLDHCWELWNAMVEQRGMRPNEIVLGCMLDALVCNDKVDDAVVLFRKWKETVPPNTVIYATLIKGFANSRQAARAMEIWHEMRQLALPMNKMVYHSLIDAQARVGAMDQVSELVDDLLSNGCKLDVISYSAIVKGYCVMGDLDRAFEVFRDMQRNSMAENDIIYNTVLDGCTKYNRMDLADAVIDDMASHDIKPSIFTLGILVKMYGRRGQLNKAFEVLDLYAQKHGTRPNLQVKTCLMCACIYNHDFKRAFAVFEDLKATLGADAKAYSALISGIVRNSQGRLPQAVELVREAYGFRAEDTKCQWAPTAPGVQPEALEQLLRALGTQGMLESLGLPLIQQLRSARVPINGRLLSTFVGDDT